MPQMSPMMWDMLYSNVALMFLTSYCKNYIFAINPTMKNNNLKNLTHNPNWTW